MEKPAVCGCLHEIKAEQESAVDTEKHMFTRSDELRPASLKAAVEVINDFSHGMDLQRQAD